jgi:hypothetical protein
MLEELLKHEKFGNKNELQFFLFDCLSSEGNQNLLSLKKYCTSNIFSISRNFEGIIKLFEFISFISVKNDKISINPEIFDQKKYDKFSYFDCFHFYEHLLVAMQKAGNLKEMLNGNNLKYSPHFSQFYVLENRFPYQFFSFRNMFFSTGFFHRNETASNQLFIKQEFNEEFRKFIVNIIPFTTKSVKKISLEQLKKSQQTKEDAGKRAEIFALEFELKRLQGHPELEKVEIISEEHSNAGYDIESFEDIDSIIFDRFIEVKSFDGEISFYWSRNEVHKAKELRTKYFLYLVDRSRIIDKNYKPQIFQDPYKKVFENELWKKETENWKISYIE